MKTLATFILFLTLSSAEAGPITNLACQSKTTATYATVGIRADLFAPSTQRILAYTVQTGKTTEGGHGTKGEKSYEFESNMKIFDTDEGAYAWVKKNSVVIPLYTGEKVDAVLVVDSAKRQVTLIDPTYETIEVLPCVIN